MRSSLRFASRAFSVVWVAIALFAAWLWFGKQHLEGDPFVGCYSAEKRSGPVLKIVKDGESYLIFSRHRDRWGAFSGLVFHYPLTLTRLSNSPPHSQLADYFGDSAPLISDVLVNSVRFLDGPALVRMKEVIPGVDSEPTRYFIITNESSPLYKGMCETDA